MVVDLLVSLIYASAISGHLESFPDGLRLKVPFKSSHAFDQTGEMQNNDLTTRALLDPVTMILSGSGVGKLDSGDWIMIRDAELAQPTVTWHCQVTRIPLKGGEVVLSDPVKHINQIISPVQTATQSSVPPYSNITKHHVRFSRYDQDFEGLSTQDKRGAIKLLLDTLPSISRLANLLGESSTRGLRSCLEGKVSPAAFDLLRWIIASNRSYIVHETEKSAHHHEQMSKHVRFRFIQGAPDREQRFLKAVQAHARNVQPSTISAWHGSPLHNWHGILREGLHFRKISHGRASGNGVYLSDNFATSLAFSTRAMGSRNWPQSVLDMQYVISLNEIVNCPDKFVCKMPHYVVQFIDWIQPRYLLVGGKVSSLQPTTPFRVSPPQGPKVKRPMSKTGFIKMTEDDDDGPSQIKAKVEGCAEAPQSIPSNPGVISSSDSLLSAKMDAKQGNEERETSDRVSKKTRKYSASQLDAIWNSLDSEDGGLLLP
jgi:ubiquitin-conjugating enzyme E2 Q